MAIAQDIVPATHDVALGQGWGPLETHRADNYRWVSNDAEFYVATLKSVNHQVQLHVEPGPGVGLKPFELKVLEDGKTIATLNVKGRQALTLLLNAGEPAVHKLTLHTDDGGRATPNDPRVLNFRLFKIAVQRMPAEVFAAGRGFRLGSGWYPLETFGGESFRWVNNDATIEVANPEAAELALEVEPGPGFDMKPFTLKVLDAAGAERSTFAVKERQRISMPLDKTMKFPAILRLHVDGGGKRASSSDARIMNFRVFEYNPISTLKPVSPKPAPPAAAKPDDKKLDENKPEETKPELKSA